MIKVPRRNVLRVIMSVCGCEALQEKELYSCLERSMAFQKDVQGFKENGRELVYAVGIMFVSMIVLGIIAEFATWLKK